MRKWRASIFVSGWLLGVTVFAFAQELHPMSSPPLSVPEPASRVLAPEPPTSAAQWRETGRATVLRLLGENIYGITPLGRLGSERFVVRETKKGALGGKATRLRVGILFEGSATGRQMELLVYLPSAARKPVPLFIGLNFDGNYTTTHEPDLPLPTHFVQGLFVNLPDHRATEALRGKDAAMWPYETILARGYGVATACYGEIEPDAANQWWHGPRVFAPPTRGDSWGTIGAWAWSLGRALDYLQTNPKIETKAIAVFGFSRLGKTAMWAGAQDERFAAVVSQNSGKGGVSLMKRGQGEPVSHLAGADLGHWFAPNFAHYSDNEASLPVDGGDIAALIAPRPLLILSATDDAYSDPKGEFEGGKAATPIYNLLGYEGLKAETWPAPQTLINSRIGYYLRPGGHNVTPEDWAATLDWADKNLKIPAARKKN